MNFFAIVFVVIVSVVVADRHAIIIAPRYVWDDYGVQSESCRMYKDLIAGGMKAENIVLLLQQFPKNLLRDLRRGSIPGFSSFFSFFNSSIYPYFFMFVDIERL